MPPKRGEQSLHWQRSELPPECFHQRLTTVPSSGSKDTLPVERAERRIRNAMESNSVIAVRAEPGSGKTLMLPVYVIAEQTNKPPADVGIRPVLLVLKSCLAASKAISSFESVGRWGSESLHLRTGSYDPELKAGRKYKYRDSVTSLSVITYGVLWKWFSTSLLSIAGCSKLFLYPTENRSKCFPFLRSRPPRLLTACYLLVLVYSGSLQASSIFCIGILESYWTNVRI